MGTNYELQERDPVPKPCPCCGEPGKVLTGEALHIGKSSSGWCFTLHVMPELGIADLADWDRKFRDPRYKIVNEYGEVITPMQMMDIITNRVGARRQDVEWWSPWYDSYEDFLAKNSAVPGPNGLLRHRLGRGCIGHGAGTWDLITGEFS